MVILHWKQVTSCGKATFHVRLWNLCHNYLLSCSSANQE